MAHTQRATHYNKPERGADRGLAAARLAWLGGGAQDGEGGAAVVRADPRAAPPDDGIQRGGRRHLAVLDAQIDAMNPVVAVFLGAIFLGERITPLILLGMALIVAGVAGLSLDGTGTSANGHSR